MHVIVCVYACGVCFACVRERWYTNSCPHRAIAYAHTQAYARLCARARAPRDRDRVLTFAYAGRRARMHPANHVI